MSISLFQIVFTQLKNVTIQCCPGIQLDSKSVSKLQKHHKTYCAAANSMLDDHVCYAFWEKLILI